MSGFGRDFICAICSGPSGRSSHGRAARAVRAAASMMISFARFEKHGGICSLSGGCLLRDGRRVQDDEWLRGDFICAICSGPSGRSSHGRAARAVRAAASMMISFARFEKHGGICSLSGGCLLRDGRRVQDDEWLRGDFICAICSGPSGRSSHGRAAQAVRAAASMMISFARFEKHGGLNRAIRANEIASMQRARLHPQASRQEVLVRS